jgi:HlyD family secretion protein
MKTGRVVAGLTIAIALVAGAWMYRHSASDSGTHYRFVNVERGDLKSTVSATGALSALKTVQVGTQVSGQVAEIFVDFNDHVTKGQLVARIDPTIQQQAVRESEASLERSQADFTQAQRERDRTKELFDKRVVTESELDQVQYQLDVAAANLKSAEISVERARRNLSYTAIHSPIDGIVVERNVDVGQTVAASLSAPQLFLIANDLSRMQILASVDESDIGMIEQNQPVQFTVQAYPDTTFVGRVEQVRLQSASLENVVNYTVVATVDNAAGKLLPGMTATVDFVTARADDVLAVPNAALRFRPSEEMLAEIGESQPSVAPADGVGGDTARGISLQRGGGEARRGSGGGGPQGRPDRPRTSNAARLWYVDEAGQLAVLPVKTGISDGRLTEIRGEGIKPGMQVIAGITSSNVPEGVANPFENNNDRRGGRGRGF